MPLDGTNESAGTVVDLLADSLALSGQTAIFVQKGQLKSQLFEAGSKAVGLAPGTRFNRVSSFRSSNQESIFGTAFDGGQWKAVCLAADLSPRWESPVGSQLFESLIDPLAPLRSQDETQSQQVDLAIATTQNTVHIFGSKRGWLADVQLSETPTGVALAELNGEICLLVSTGSAVECWSLK